METERGSRQIWSKDRQGSATRIKTDRWSRLNESATGWWVVSGSGRRSERREYWETLKLWLLERRMFKNVPPSACMIWNVLYSTQWVSDETDGVIETSGEELIWFDVQCSVIVVRYSKQRSLLFRTICVSQWFRTICVSQCRVIGWAGRVW